MQIKRENIEHMQRSITLVNEQLNKFGPHILDEDEVVEIIDIMMDADDDYTAACGSPINSGPEPNPDNSPGNVQLGTLDGLFDHPSAPVPTGTAQPQAVKTPANDSPRQLAHATLDGLFEQPRAPVPIVTAQPQAVQKLSSLSMESMIICK